LIIEIVSLCLCIILLVASIFATYRAIRYPYSESRQKWFQVILVWLVPGLGAGLVLVLLSDKSLPSRGKYQEDYTNSFDINSEDPFRH
jgi:hypothetical protein